MALVGQQSYHGDHNKLYKMSRAKDIAMRATAMVGPTICSKQPLRRTLSAQHRSCVLLALLIFRRIQAPDSSQCPRMMTPPTVAACCSRSPLLEVLQVQHSSLGGGRTKSQEVPCSWHACSLRRVEARAACGSQLQVRGRHTLTKGWAEFLRLRV